MISTYLTCLLLSFWSNPAHDFTLIFNNDITYEVGKDAAVVLGLPEEITVKSTTAIKSVRIKLSDDKSYVWDSGDREGNMISIPKNIESSSILVFVYTIEGTNYVFPLQVLKSKKLDI